MQDAPPILQHRLRFRWTLQINFSAKFQECTQTRSTYASGGISHAEQTLVKRTNKVYVHKRLIAGWRKLQFNCMRTSSARPQKKDSGESVCVVGDAALILPAFNSVFSHWCNWDSNLALLSLWRNERLRRHLFIQASGLKKFCHCARAAVMFRSLDLMILQSTS